MRKKKEQCLDDSDETQLHIQPSPNISNSDRSSVSLVLLLKDQLVALGIRPESI